MQENATIPNLNEEIKAGLVLNRVLFSILFFVFSFSKTIYLWLAGADPQTPSFWLGGQSPPRPSLKRASLAFDRGGQTGPPR